ncbi:UNVERIFIED_CONTAM: hypothetical protein RMT77_003828 [Armadillidium vulgare]
MDEGEYEERRGRSRGRPRGRQRGRPRTQGRTSRVHKRNKIESDDEEEEEKKAPVAEVIVPTQFDKDCDISALEAPTFTTLDRGPPAPMLQLTWNHPVTLIGEKVLSPRIHSCDTCNKPILIYGRMIPCKHVFCLWCAKSEDRVCARCGERVARVEQTGLGTVFMCTFSINDALCKRTYLSQRDLQAHIDHRHMKISGSSAKEESKEERLSHRDPRGESRPPAESRSQQIRVDPRPTVAANDPRVGNKESFDPRDGFQGPNSQQSFPRKFNPSQPPPQSHLSSATPVTVSHHIPVMTSSRTNLITVPIQDPSQEPQTASFQSTHAPPPYPPPPHVPPHTPINHPPPPPPSHPFTSPPPISHNQPPPPFSASVTSSFNPPYSATQQPPQYTYPPTGAPPPAPLGHPPYSSTIPPVPVPPPPTTYGSQFNTTQWTTPPPQPQAPPPPGHPISHPPPRHPPPPPPNAQSGSYYR